MYKMSYLINNEKTARVMTFRSYEIMHKTLLGLYKKYGTNIPVEVEFVG